MFSSFMLALSLVAGPALVYRFIVYLITPWYICVCMSVFMCETISFAFKILNPTFGKPKDKKQ